MPGWDKRYPQLVRVANMQSQIFASSAREYRNRVDYNCEAIGEKNAYNLLSVIIHSSSNKQQRVSHKVGVLGPNSMALLMCPFNRLEDYVSKT